MVLIEGHLEVLNANGESWKNVRTASMFLQLTHAHTHPGNTV